MKYEEVFDTTVVTSGELLKLTKREDRNVIIHTNCQNDMANGWKSHSLYIAADDEVMWRRLQVPWWQEATPVPTMLPHSLSD